MWIPESLAGRPSVSSTGRIRCPEELFSRFKVLVPGDALISTPPGPGRMSLLFPQSRIAPSWVKVSKPSKGGRELPGITGAVYVPLSNPPARSFICT
jgi:hypothetical protein